MVALVFAEHDGAELAPATLNVVTAAGALAAGALDGEIHVLVAGQGCGGVAEATARVSGVTKVLVADDAAYAHLLAENTAPLIARLAPGYGHVLAAHNANAKNVMPRAAALLDVAQVSDIIAVVAPDTFVRPIYAGNALATVRSNDPIKFVTVRTTAFAAAPATGGAAAVEEVSGAGDSGLSIFVGEALSSSERPELTSAGIVISGGRGMQSGENFQMLEELADLLGAAVGASRAAVDAGFVPN